MIDRIGSRGNAFWESLCEEARFVSCHDLGDRDVEIYRIDNDGAQAFHFYERVIGDTNAVAIGKGCLDHEVAHDAEPLAGERYPARVILIRNGLPPVRNGRHLIMGIGTCDHFKYGCCVAHGATQRATPIARE
jgi:hypothetical protein